MGSSSLLLRAAVVAVALLLLATTGEAFFDLLNIFRPRSESDLLNALGGSPEQKVPEQTEQEEKGAAPATATGLTKVPPQSPTSKAAGSKLCVPVAESITGGSWTIVSENSGVSAMHMVVMRHDRAIMFDTPTTGRSLMRLAVDNCRPDTRSTKKDAMDCWAHAVEFDFNTGALRSLRILTDTWCSSGGLDADGNLVQTGGYFEGDKAVRYLSPCANCTWREFPKSFAEGRWYATQQVLPDGRFIVIGGRRAFSYEFVPQRGMTNGQAVPFPLLFDTTDPHENNLYPFVNLLPDGDLFIFANDRSVIFDYRNGKIIRELPVLGNGTQAHNYPASAMSALLPLDLRNVTAGLNPEAEIIVCGGAQKDAFWKADNNSFWEALGHCGRISPIKPDAAWEMEKMPAQRVMGDLLILPTSDLLMLNGAGRGCAGWGFAREPVLSPVLYAPRRPHGKRFTALAASTIARMYHSTSAVLPDATVLVAGGNTNAAYNFSGVDFPTEVRVERFTPPYLMTADNRPEIDVATVAPGGMRYGVRFGFSFHTPLDAVGEADVKVTMYAPPFTTHGYSMNQRLLILRLASFSPRGLVYDVTVDAPGKPALAPAGYYLLYVVAENVPSKAVWIKIH